MTTTLSMPPEGYVRVETDILFDGRISNAARVTWLQLRALAWGRNETPPFSPAEFEALTGTGRSTLYGHLKLLRTCDDLRWRTLSDQTMVVSFMAAATSEPEQARIEEDKPETPVQKSGQSRNLDSSCIKDLDQKIANPKDKTVASRNLDESRKLDGKRLPDALFEALSDVSGRTPPDRDWTKLPGVARGILNKAASQLRKINATPEQICGFWDWWKVHDFRGRQNKRPDPWEVVKQWTVYLNAQNGHYGHTPNNSPTQQPDDKSKSVAAAINARRAAAKKNS